MITDLFVFKGSIILTEANTLDNNDLGESVLVAKLNSIFFIVYKMCSYIVSKNCPAYL